MPNGFYVGLIAAKVSLETITFSYTLSYEAGCCAFNHVWSDVPMK